MAEKKHFDLLVSLVNALSREELKVIKAFVTALDLSDKKDSLSLKLIDYLRGKEDATWEQAKKKIGPNVQERSFDRLIVRLNDKLMEGLELEVNTKKESQYSETSRAQFRISRWLNQAYLIKGRGIETRYEELLDKCIVEAEHYEFYDLLGQALFRKTGHMAVKMRPKERAVYRERQEKNWRDLALYEQCINRFYDYQLEAAKSGIGRGLISMLIETLTELQEAYRVSQSQRIGYFYYRLGTDYYLTIDEFRQGIRTSEALLQLVNASPHLFGRQLRGIALRDLAEKVQYTFDFEASLTHAREAKRSFEGLVSNYNNALELEASALFGLNRFAESLGVIDELVDNTDSIADAYLHSKRNYLKSYTLFAMGEFRKSYVYLMETKQIEQDREGWNIGIRILTILNKIEMVLLESAEAHLESMRKYIQRLSELTPMRDRDLIIFDILRNLEKESFNFKLVQHNCAPQFAELESTEKGLRWEPGTHELIPFQEWFAAKAEGRAVRFQLSPELVEWAQSDRKQVAFEVLVEN